MNKANLLTILTTLLMFVTSSTSAQTPVLYDAIDFDRNNAPFVKVRKDGKVYFSHPLSGVLVDQVEDHAGDMLTIVKDGAYGVVHVNGKPLCSFDYDEIALLTAYDGQWYSGIPYNYQFAKIRKKGKYGLIDHHGKIIAEPRFEALEVINRDIIGFKDNGKWGWLRVADGKIVQMPLYDELRKSYLFRHTLEIYLDGKQGIAHESGKVLIAPQYERLNNIYLNTGKYVEFTKDKGSGLMDSLGTIILPPVHKYLNPCSGSDFLKIEKGGLQGLIDVTGKEVTPAVYDKINDFVRGRAIVEKAGKKGLIGEKGQLLLSPQYEQIEFRKSTGQVVFAGPIISVSPQSNRSKEYLDRIAAEAKIDAMPYYIWVRNHDNKVGLYDWEGAKLILPHKFTEIAIVYQQGEVYFYAVDGSLFAIYDKLGKEILPLKYHLQTDIYINRAYNYRERNISPYILPVFDKKQLGLYDVQKKKFIIPVSDLEISWLNAKFFEVRRSIQGVSYTKESAVYNVDGQMLIPFNKDIYQLKMLNDNLILAELEKQYMVFDTKGTRIFQHPDWKRNSYYRGFNIPERRNENDNPFKSGLFKIHIKGENLFIDETGKEIRFSGFDYVGDFYNDLAWVVREIGDKVFYGLIDIKGNVVLEPQFDRLEILNDHPNLLIVRKKERYGVVNDKGKIILDPVYDLISTFSPELLQVTLKQKSGLVDKEGKIVVQHIFDTIRRNYNSSNRTWPILVKKGNEFLFINDGGKEALIRGKSRIE